MTKESRMRVKFLVTCFAIFAIAICAALPIQAQAKNTKAKGGSFDSLSLPKTNKLGIQQQKTEEARWDLRTAPVALVARWYTLDAFYRITKNWSTGPAAIVYAASSPGGMFFPNYKGYAVGWGGNHYFTSVRTDGWYASLHAYYESYESYPHGSMSIEKRDGFKANSALGYRWRINNGFDLLTGLGVENDTHSVIERREGPLLNNLAQETRSNRSTWLPFIEIKIGLGI